MSTSRDMHKRRKSSGDADSAASINPSRLGPAQPLPDNDRDQVPGKADTESMSSAEHRSMARAIERERDA